MDTQQPQQQQQPLKEKTKVRFTSLDITALISELKKTLVGQRVTNIYDLSNKMYMFKMGSSENKQSLIIENGVRFNTTTREIKTKTVPSAFTMKFRKYLRSKRLEDIRQVGVERVVVMTFGQDDLTNHLILELYSQGNIILTDKDFKILQLIRSHTFNENVKTALNEQYPFDYAANLYIENFDTSEENIKKVIQVQKIQEERELEEKQKKEQEEAEKKKQEQEKEQADSDSDNENQKKKKKKQQQQQQNKKQQQKKQPNLKKSKAEKEKKLKDVVFKLVPSLHQPVIDHIIQTLGINPNQKCTEEQIPDIQRAANKCIELLNDFMKSQTKGYLIVSDKSKSQENPQEIQDDQSKKDAKNKEQYFDFSPLVLGIHEGKQIKEMASFNEVIDIYFEKLILKDKNPEVILQKQKENIILKKFNNIIRDQDQRISALQKEQETSMRKAQLIEQNIQDVEALTNIVKQMKQGGLAWDKISKMINEGKESGDPMAELIHEMDFENNRITILLEDPEEDAEEDMVPVEVDIYLNAYANAKQYYTNKKQNVKKEQKTQEAKQIALKQAEITAQREMEKQQIKENAITSRKTYWFEKFYWFISSENYLVISGRDAAQNEVIIKKYMKKGDIYMHADYHGSASTVIKNNKPNEPIPQQTLDEAAQASTCRSKAWDSKILATVYWVYDHQVSKRAETGEYLPHGSFMIRGKKNFITPMRMEMGVVLLFKIEDQEALQRHANDRTIKGALDEEEDDKNKKLTLLKEESQSSQMTSQTDDLPTYEMLKQQSSVLTEKMRIEEDKQVTIVETQPNQKTKQQQQQQQGKQQGKQGQTKKQQQYDENKKKLEIKQKEAEKKGKKLSKAEQKKLMRQLQEENDDEDEQKKEHTVNVPRGKANKIRKMKEKYADQTEEERQIQMQLMGAKQVEGFDWKKESKRKSKKFNKGNNKQKDEEEDDQDEEQLQKIKEQEEKQKQLEKEEEEKRIQEEKEANKPKFLVEKEKEMKEKEEERKERIKKKKENNEQSQKEQLERENKKQQQVEEKESKTKEKDQEKKEGEDNEEEEEEEKEEVEQEVNTNNLKYEEEENQMNKELSELNYLVSYITPEDVFRNMVFMCAPYNAIQNQNCKYRVKLVPGTQKKGRSGKEIISYFQTLKESKPIEKKIMKCITEQEFINQMIGNVKIQAAGLMKIKLDQKAAKKKQKKDLDKAEMEIKEKGLLN